VRGRAGQPRGELCLPHYCLIFQGWMMTTTMMAMMMTSRMMPMNIHCRQAQGREEIEGRGGRQPEHRVRVER